MSFIETVSLDSAITLEEFYDSEITASAEFGVFDGSSYIDCGDDDLLSFTAELYAEFNGSTSYIQISDDDLFTFLDFVNYTISFDGTDWMTFPVPGSDWSFNFDIYINIGAITNYNTIVSFGHDSQVTSPSMFLIDMKDISGAVRVYMECYTNEGNFYDGTDEGLDYIVLDATGWYNVTVTKSGGQLTYDFIYPDLTTDGETFSIGTDTFTFNYGTLGAMRSQFWNGDNNPWEILQNGIKIKQFSGDYSLGTSYIDAAKTIECGDGDNIAIITNEGSLGGDIAQTTGTAQPTFGPSGDAPFSVTARINHQSSARWPIITKTGFNANTEWMFYVETSGVLRLRMFDDSYTTNRIQADSTSISAQDGTEIHVAATYDGSGSQNGIKLYMNGVDITDIRSVSGTYVKMSNTLAFVQIGRMWQASTRSYANGNIKDARIYNKELSPAEVLAEFNTNISLSTDIVAEYPLAGTTSDYGPNGFDGVGESITYGLDDAPFSIGGWFYVEDYTGYRPFVVKSDDSSVHEYIFIQDPSGNILFSVYTDNSNFIGRYKAGYAGAGGWHHYVATYDGNKTAAGMKIYVDAVQVDEGDNNSGTYTGMTNTNQPVEIGIWGLTYNYKGNVRDVKIFDIELSQAQINEEFTGQQLSSNIVAHYALAEDVLDSSGNDLHGLNYGVGFPPSVSVNLSSEIETIVNEDSAVTNVLYLDSPLNNE